MKNAERLKGDGYLECTYYGEQKGNLLRAKKQYNFQERNAFSVQAFKIVDQPENAQYWAKTSDGKIWLLVGPKKSRSCLASVDTCLWAITGLRSHSTWKGKNWRAWAKKWGGNSYTGN
jgi:hypothetical protein